MTSLGWVYWLRVLHTSLTTTSQVDSSADEAKLKTAYRKGALKHHPGIFLLA